MRGLLIHADDFGLTPGVSAGIVDAIHAGAVATTSAMVCGEGAAEILASLASRIPGRVGLHLQLTDGAPCSEPSEILSLVGADGRFPRKRAGLGRLEPQEVAREWRAQVRALRALGIEPARLDSHHHVHLLPDVFEVYCSLAQELGVPARAGEAPHTRALIAAGVPCADVFTSGWFGGELDVQSLVACAAAAARACPEGGVVELMSHPGHVDDELRRRSSYTAERERELRTLCSPELPGCLRAAGLELVGTDGLRSLGPPADDLD